MVSTDLLLFAAHCDDGELWAGGTIANLVESGKRVTLAIAHHDSTRRGEAEAGAAILGCEVWFREDNADLFEWVCSCLHEARPDVLITHPIDDPHFEHDEISRIVNRALTKSRQRKEYPRRWYWCDTYNSTSKVGFPLLIDISAYFDRKCSALECHRSQSPVHLVEMAQAMNALHGGRIRVKYAEAFYVFPLLGRWPRLRELP
jgi:LmbE family N-acetylglucosaminyl deacetylase